MRTKIKSILLLGSILLVSCADFLKEEPTTSLGKTAVFASEETMRRVLLGCYVQYNSYEFRGLFYEMNNSLILACPMESTASATSCGVLDEINPEETRTNAKVYGQGYKVLEHLNHLIEGAKESPVEESRRAKIVAEAKFLRATVLLDLVRTYGRIPLKLKPVETMEDALLPRASLADIYKQIIADYQEAERFMPEKGQQMEGFPHKWAATAYLSKTYLWIACLTDDHLECTRELGAIATSGYVGSADALKLKMIPTEVAGNFSSNPNRYFWEQARDKAAEVIAANAYKLIVPYGNLWRGRNRNTEESIFELQLKGNMGFGVSISGRISPDVRTEFNYELKENTAYGRTTVNYSTFESHWLRHCQLPNGTRPTTVRDLKTNQVDDQSDPRFNESYVFYSYTGYGKNSATGIYDVKVTRTAFPNKSCRPDQRNMCYPFIKKYLDSTQVSVYGNANLIVYRYADLLLHYAEALNELGQTADAVKVVNDYILDRARRSGKVAGGSKYPENWLTSLSQEEVREAIMKEREFELVGEGQEIMEVRRKGKAYLKQRIQEHDQFYLDNRDNTYWTNRKYWPNPGVSGNVPKMWHRIYSEYIGYTKSSNDFCKKHLYIAFPQKEIDFNYNIPASEQNFGW